MIVLTYRQQPNQSTTLEKECINMIHSLIPNGDKLGEMINEIQNRVPNMPALNRSLCHHLGKMLNAVIKNHGKE